MDKNKSSTTDNKETCDYCKRNIEPDKIKDFNNCSHKICSFCLFERIFSIYIADLQGQKSLKIACKCNKSHKELKLSDILKVLNEKRKIDSKKVTEGGFENIENTEEGCDCNVKKDSTKQLFSDYFCLDCIKWVCSACQKDSSKPHYNHRVLRSRYLLSFMRRNIKDIFLKNSTLDNFESKWNNLSTKFQDVVENSFNKTVRKLDNLILKVKNLKKEFIKNYETQIRNQVKTFKIIKFFYMNYYSDKEAELAKKNVELNDIFKLKYLANISYEFMDFNLTYPQEFDNIIDKISSDLDNIKTQEMKLLESRFIFEERKKGYIYEKKEMITAHNKFIYGLGLLNNQIFTGALDYSIKIWSNEDNKYKLKQSIKTKQIINLLILKNSKILASARDFNDILVYELNDKNIYFNSQTLSGHGNVVSALIELIDGKIISASHDKKIIIWEENQKLKQYMVYKKIEQKASILMLISLDGNKIAFSLGDSTQINIMKPEVELSDGKLSLKEFNDFCFLEKLSGKVLCMCKLNNDNFAYGGIDVNQKTNNIYIWREFGDKFIISQTILNAHESDINSILLLRDGRMASSSKDRTIKIWGIKKPINETNIEYIMEQHLIDYAHGLYKMIQLYDDRIVATASDNNLIFWRNIGGVI